MVIEEDMRIKHMNKACEDSSFQRFSGEQELIPEALSQARWNKKKAAEILQVDRTYVTTVSS